MPRKGPVEKEFQISCNLRTFHQRRPTKQTQGTSLTVVGSMGNTERNRAIDSFGLALQFIMGQKSSLVFRQSGEKIARRESLVRKEIGRQGGKIAGSGIGISLASRAVESHHQYRATPRFLGLSTSGYPLNGVVNRGPSGQREGAIEDMKRVSQGFSV